MHFSVPQTRYNYLYQLTFSSMHRPWADSSQKKNYNNLKSRQKFRLKKMQAQTVVQSLEFFFPANLSWPGVAVNKKRAKV